MTSTEQDLDRVTPRWPEAQVNLTAPASVTISGVSTPLTSSDVQAEAVALVAKQADAHGHPIRVKASTTDGWVQRMIVTHDGQVTLVGKQVGKPGMQASGPGKQVSKPLPKASDGKKPGRFTTIPGWFRWAALGMTGLVLVAGAVLIFHKKPAPQATEPVTPPIPPAGDIYTETAPPGWTTHAAWVVPLVSRAPAPVTDPTTGYTAALTPTNMSAPDLGPFDENDVYLSVLGVDGHTLWATPLDGIPIYGPRLALVDGVTVVAVVDSKTVEYWPLTSGGEPTVVQLPSGARATPKAPGTTLLFTVGRDTAGYLSEGTLQTVEVLPRTLPIAAVDGAVLQYQSDAQAWWQVSANHPPTRVNVTPDVAAAVAKPVTVKPVPGQLIPTGQTATRLMVVTQNRLYALTKAG